MKTLIATATACGLLVVGGAPGHTDRTQTLSHPALERADSPVQRAAIPYRPTLSPPLIERLSEAQPDEFIPISIVMREQVAPDVLAAAGDMGAPHERRAAVIGTLRDHADRVTADMVEVLDQHRLQGAVEGRINALWIHAVVTASATPKVIGEIAARPDVERINYDRPIGDEVLLERGSPDGTPTCGVDLVKAPMVWDQLDITGRKVVVGVIDTGTCLTHPDLAGQIWKNPCEEFDGTDTCGNGYVDDVHGWNFWQNNNNLTDGNSHGTHVAGTVAGDGTNGTATGVAPSAEIMTLKFWNNFSGESTVWEAMQYGVANGAHVLTASLGWPYSQGPDRVTWRNVCENSIFAGVVVIYAAGNEGNCCPPTGSVRTPGDVPDVITVGAVNCSDNLANFSSNGPVTWQTIAPWNDWPHPPGKLKPTISGPGVSTVSTSNNCTGYTTKSGTSMATPHVAGTVALMLEANRCLDHFGAKQILKDTSLDLGTPGPNNQYGHGRIDAFEAVSLALSTFRPADLDCSGSVDGADLGILLANWGDCDDCDDCIADINNDCVVDGADLGMLLADWG